MKEKSIDIIIKPDGTMDFDQIGYEGKICSGDIDELIKQLGTKIKTTKKQEYYKQQKVKLNQKRID